MAHYRSIQTIFWRDPYVLEELTPEERYFYIYLMTNPKTTQCGIYEISLKITEVETGYSRETVEKHITRLQERNKILYCQETKEIMVLNWLKHHPIDSSPIKKCIEKELQNVKNKEFIKKFMEIVTEAGYKPNMIPLIGGLEGAYIPLGEKEKQKEKEEKKQEEEKKEKQKEKDSFVHLVTPEKFYSDNFGPIGSLIAEYIQDYLEWGMEEALIIEAMKIAIERNIRTWAYVDGILKNMKISGFKTVEQYASHESERKRKEDEMNGGSIIKNKKDNADDGIVNKGITRL